MAKTVVKIIGRREPLVVSDTGRGHRLSEAWNNADDDAKLEIQHDEGVWRGRWGEIKSIDRAREEVQGRGTLDVAKPEEELFIQNRLKMSAEAKGEEVARFNLWYGVHYGKKVSDKAPAELLKKLVKKQTEYYKKNPKAIEVPYSLYESLIPKETPQVPKAVLKRMDAPSEIGTMVGGVAKEVFPERLPGEEVLSDAEAQRRAKEIVL